MRIVVDRAFAMSSNATRVHPHRAAALAHRDRDLLAERVGRLGQHDDVGALVEGEAGDRRRRRAPRRGCSSESTVTDAASPAASEPPAPRAASTAMLPAAKRASTTAMAMPNRRVGARDREAARSTPRRRGRTPRPTPRSATTCAATHWFCRPKPCGQTQHGGDERRCRARRPSRGCGGAFHPP